MNTDTQTNGGGIPALELKALCKSFGGLEATRDVTLRVMPGDRKAIIGPNGAGKTTVFNLITGIFPVSSGKILLFGQDVTKWPSHRRAALGMARTFQVTSLFPKLTVLDNVLLAIEGMRQTKFVMWRFMSRIAPSTTRPSVSSRGPASSTAKTPKCATCRMANSASSRLCWGWRAIPNSCCSMSRPPASPQASRPK